MKAQGRVTLPALREMVTLQSSSGWRRTSKAERLELGEFVEKQHAMMGE